MPKEASFLDLPLELRAHGQTRHESLYRTLRAAILDGRLKPHARLPSTRDMARQYGLARGTVVTVFEQLTTEGYLASRTGAGTFVTATLPDDFLQAGKKHVQASARDRIQPSVPANDLRHVALARNGQALARSPFPVRFSASIIRPFSAHLPALDAFPCDLWAKLTARRARRLSVEMMAGHDARGYLPLRETIAEYLGATRGIACNAEQIVITTGFQQALDLTVRLLLNPGDAVWIEDPGYLGARHVLQAGGARIIPVPVDHEGINVAFGEQQCPDARLAYVTPAHQAPLGMPMSVSRRLALLQWATRQRAWIIEDDYDSEYRYAGRPLAALCSLDTGGVVIHAGSFSKTVFPSLRIGYLVLPDALVESFISAMSVTNRYCAVLPQAVLRDFIADGHFARHVRRMRQLYVERRDALTDAVNRHLSGAMHIGASDAGLNALAWLASPYSEATTVEAARGAGLIVQGLSENVCEHRVSDGVLLGFAAIPPEQILGGIQSLEKALAK